VSPLAREIRQCMSGLAMADDGTLKARFVFPAEFLGFQGHFPGEPVLPAVCEIQGAMTMLEAWEKRPVGLGEIILAKFSAPVTCDEEVEYTCAVEAEGLQGAVIKATVVKQGRTAARFRLRVVFGDEVERR
jgi:3-hydroxyacyl-[acyl-carrier-protein] dehydratase